MEDSVVWPQDPDDPDWELEDFDPYNPDDEDAQLLENLAEGNNVPGSYPWD